MAPIGTKPVNIPIFRQALVQSKDLSDFQKSVVFFSNLE